MTSPDRHTVLIRTSGWSIPAAERSRFADKQSVLERYASVFSAVEINSSFYRPHRPETYAKWAAATPPMFRFSVKVPKQISHLAKLQDCDAELDRFLFESSHLSDKLGCLLLQLPPSLGLEPPMEQFFENLRQRFHGPVAFEPRHQSWLDASGLKLMKTANLWLVQADPSLIELKGVFEEPPRYLRLHGSPRIYYSGYSDDELARYAETLNQATDVSWCIFDNTASGAATSNALTFQRSMR